MSDDSTQARRTLYLWALGLNVVAWGGYLVLTKATGIDFESIRLASSAGGGAVCPRSNSLGRPKRYSEMPA